jgi:hypothetical protein
MLMASHSSPQEDMRSSYTQWLDGYIYYLLPAQPATDGCVWIDPAHNQKNIRGAFSKFIYLCRLYFWVVAIQ